MDTDNLFQSRFGLVVKGREGIILYDFNAKFHYCLMYSSFGGHKVVVTVKY